MSAPRFEPLGPLPRGRTAIEASAGTGKTYALAGLATRFVVEGGVPVSELLVVTFTRAASAELRDRVRDRIAEAADALSRAADPAHAVPAPTAAGPGDALIEHLTADDVDVRLARARAAMADFDAATITTIHGFAQQVLATLGAAAPGDADAVLDDDQGELLRQVATDVLVAESLRPTAPGAALPPLGQLVTAAREVMGNPGIAVVPPADPAASTPVAALRRRLVDAVVAGIDERRRAAGVLSFDDLLTRLRDAIADPVAGPATKIALRRRFAVALIDEFQDTDPVQWDIFRALFGEEDSPTTLILVGDPKQAIYGFRGANVHTYLEAAHDPATTRATLAVNWRSDGAALQGLDALLSGATFGDERITFTPVEPAPQHRDRRLGRTGGGHLPGVSVRLALGDDLGRVTNASQAVTVAEAEDAIFGDLAIQVRELLRHARIPGPDGERAVRPSDITVLVTAHSESPKVRRSLRDMRIPAVIARGETVLTSPAATQWRWLLEAVAQPADPQRARTACLSWFVGWTADQLADADEQAVAQVQATLHRWADTLLNRGVAELRRQIWTESGVVARVLRGGEGDRAVTDLEHIAELLVATAPRRPGPAGLLSSLNELELVTTPADVDIDLAARRVESEADAVQIMTVHASKGLEFSIVCCPTLWRTPSATPGICIFRDPESGRRTIDVAPGEPWPDKPTSAGRARLAEEEAHGQSLRLLYVALTRARHQTLIWWTRTGTSAKSALARVLFARDAAGIDHAEFLARAVGLPADSDAVAHLQPVVARSGGTVHVELVGRPAPGELRDVWEGEAAGTADDLGVATLERTPDRSRRRWSFTAITHAGSVAGTSSLPRFPDDADGLDEADEAGGGGAAGVAGGTDEPAADAAVEPAPPDEPGTELPLGAQRGGAAFGTLVHRVLERVEVAAPDLRARLVAPVDEEIARSGLEVDRDALLDGLLAMLSTPLGPIANSRALHDIRGPDRLAELDFELTLANGGAVADDRAVGRLVVAHLAPDHALRAWAEQLAAGCFGTVLAGHLVGSIDAVLRITSPPGTEPSADRFVVVDYKSNLLTPHGAAPSIDDYHPDRLPAAMVEHHYPLQALLYCVALHRYLRWRVPGYRPEVHLGGAAYLFLRGMVGPDTPTVDGRPYGVFAWDVPPALVCELSDLLHGRAVAA